MYKKIFYFALTLISINTFTLHATHNRAGQITYIRIAPFYKTISGEEVVPVYHYSIIITTYTDFDTSPTQNGKADRCRIDSIKFGDGQVSYAFRSNGFPCTRCSTVNVGCGINISTDPAYPVRENVYITDHYYPGPGNYIISVFDPNRNADVLNIQQSVHQPFYLEAFLQINTFIGANTSPIMQNKPIDKGCVNKCFEHNPGAYDPDGDSLSYEITDCRGKEGITVTGYTHPNVNFGGTYSMDPIKGTLSWCSPSKSGEYNMAFIIREWRKNTSGIYVNIGYVLRDMQVIIGTCPKNDVPLIFIPKDTCVEAGTYINKNIFIQDTNQSQSVLVEVTAGAMNAQSPLPVITTTFGTMTGTNPGFYLNFYWKTTCDHVQHLPYYTVFKATDNGSPKLVNFESWAIRVLPPSVKNVKAVPLGGNINLSWDASSCNPINNPITGYFIYRKNDCSKVIYAPCKTGIDASTGYTLIGQTSANTLSYIDNNHNEGLVVGQDYGYMIVTKYLDGTETFGSTQVCTRLKKDVPIILNADILSTSISDGSVYVRWVRPLLNKNNLDTVLFPGPYTFNLKSKTNESSYQSIFSSNKKSVQQLDTEYVNAKLNTVNNQYEYLVEFLSGTITIGNSHAATTVSLSANPSDRMVKLDWQSNTPWINNEYSIYRKGPSSTSFSVIGTTKAVTYTDSNNVENKLSYCYKVESKGAYSDTAIFNPLINRSQEVCTTAIDNIAPCSPTISMEADCPVGFVKIKWTDVTKICGHNDDVAKYDLFYKSIIADEYYKKASFKSSESLSYVLDSLPLIAGCYVIQSIDANGNKSPYSTDFCIDNCPEFELPNIFTPNGDVANDFFKAIKVRQIKEIYLNIVDRWGNLVYQSKDPHFKWDGISIATKHLVAEGTFFYVCDVFEPHLTGIVKRTLKGYLQMAR